HPLFGLIPFRDFMCGGTFISIAIRQALLKKWLLYFALSGLRWTPRFLSMGLRPSLWYYALSGLFPPLFGVTLDWVTKSINIE
ncbi:MAG: hypothetical protein PHW35_10590, partial [Lentimicrobiaceae bacterium]|nr:hypothetical protein [Lentimicrobiaceae bacterium]